MKVLLIDAYDSFVHIIDQYLRVLGADTEVVRSRTRTPGQLAALEPDAVVLGPGPGHPAESGHVELVHEFAGRVPVLGVCLGHQAIGLAYGGRIEVAGQVMHGRTSTVRHDGAGLFQGLGHTLEATRYHSLLVADPLPEPLVTTAVAADHGYVMGLRHRTLAVEGVQFHPESITTTGGLAILENFLSMRSGLAMRSGVLTP
ncbi:MULTISPECIES: aminodeoxychorismate/anthranilate synthase component II [unclassified Streptomyces]|uniref:anthranilate synthase component II n=1 Tax=unclassified Streptomyces TaxID=2593676 RepID=UPI001BE79C41|nr:MULTISPECIES: aminodeoxychorismate/anthranilate synthase component II [unclassified Streptomyces]MBT2405502.1 aminodeoxychorismate/anthranilate synthase component II [Streptomyces sp. ISL-21]MBT2607819.1 aminodeoxychorismate/anthranilate synthase component II [Streptomyces sp. ISL-87]